MLFSSRENWQAMFDHVDCRAPIYDFDGNPRSFEDLLKSTPAGASSKISAAAQAERHQQTMDAMDRLHDRGYISDPRGRAKSVLFTEEGLARAERLLADLFGKRAEPGAAPDRGGT